MAVAPSPNAATRHAARAAQLLRQRRARRCRDAAADDGARDHAGAGMRQVHRAAAAAAQPLLQAQDLRQRPSTTSAIGVGHVRRGQRVEVGRAPPS